MADRGLERHHFIVAGATLITAALLGGALFVWSGIYNVSAAREHFGVTTSLFSTVRRQSIRTHSIGIETPPLDADMIRIGAGHYEAGCAPCHGAPGRPASVIGRSMLPRAPQLGESAMDWSPAELFWIVHNGQKYTGMPAWIAAERDDEVWSVVAFLRELPVMESATYASLAGLADRPTTAVGLGQADQTESLVRDSCARCHGEPGRLPASELVPVLSGQAEGYLVRALADYAKGTRQSGIMQLATAGLSDEEMGRLAALYASAPAARLETGSIQPAQRARGERIATEGLPEKGIPACFSCHNRFENGRFPHLAGQPARYISQQLQLWQKGLRGETPAGAIMSVIAARLDREAIADVAAFLQSLPAETRVPANPVVAP